MSAAADDPEPLPRGAAARRCGGRRRRGCSRAWTIPTGWRYWSAVNNTVVGLWYIAVDACCSSCSAACWRC